MQNTLGQLWALYAGTDLFITGAVAGHGLALLEDASSHLRVWGLGGIAEFNWCVAGGELWLPNTDLGHDQ